MKEYVLIGFSDGDARVYDPDQAEDQLSQTSSAITRTELARGNDRQVLVEMAVLARGYRGRHLVDMTEEGGMRRKGIRPAGVRL